MREAGKRGTAGDSGGGSRGAVETITLSNYAWFLVLFVERGDAKVDGF